MYIDFYEKTCSHFKKQLKEELLDMVGLTLYKATNLLSKDVGQKTEQETKRRLLGSCPPSCTCAARCLEFYIIRGRW